jgi:hypothetical protein
VVAEVAEPSLRTHSVAEEENLVREGLGVSMMTMFYPKSSGRRCLLMRFNE